MIEVGCRDARICFLSCFVQLHDMGLDMCIVLDVSWGVHVLEYTRMMDECMRNGQKL
jgi:hypothetical protein